MRAPHPALVSGWLRSNPPAMESISDCACAIETPGADLSGTDFSGSNLTEAKLIEANCVQAMWWQGNATYTHSVTIGSHTYGVQEGSLNSTSGGQKFTSSRFEPHGRDFCHSSK